MTYDKNSFLAGIAVGRQLKGWGNGGGYRPEYLTVPYPMLFPDEELILADAGTLTCTVVPLGVQSVPYPLIFPDDQADLVLAGPNDITQQ